MRKVLLILCAVCGLLPGCNENNNEPAVPQEPEVTLFDKNVMPGAYINYADNDTAIYIWDGTAVAYVENEKKIYRFDGRFLGWYTDGILYGKDGYAVAAQNGIVKGAISMTAPHPEPAKSPKSRKPDREIQSAEPAFPHFENSWSETSLTSFFTSE